MHKHRRVCPQSRPLPCRGRGEGTVGRNPTKDLKLPCLHSRKKKEKRIRSGPTQERPLPHNQTLRSEQRRKKFHSQG